MDDLKLFGLLRPDEPPLVEAERAAIRAALFRDDPAAVGDGANHAHSSTAGGPPAVMLDLDALRRDGRQPMREFGAARRRRVALAAAAVVVFGLGGLWAATSIRNRNEPSTPAQSPDPTACATVPTTTLPPASADPAGEYRLPRVTIDQSGWALARGADDASAGPELVVFNPVCRLDGPWVSVETAEPGVSVSRPGEQRVSVGPGTGMLSTAGNLSWLTWADADGTTWEAQGWRVDEATLTAVANAVTADEAGTVTLSSVPAGFELADPAVASALGLYSEYEFQRDDGSTVQISFYPGGERALAERATDEPGRSAVTVGDEEVSLLDYGDDGRYRVNVQRGFWTWELDGEPFATAEDFLALVSAVRVIDEQTWRATIPNNIVAGGAGRAAAVEQLLAGVPVPDGFTVGGNEWTADRYQLITQVSGAVVCAWLDQWFDATEDGDNAAAAAAADALATSHQWPMLREIETQGGWSEGIWETADAFSGGPDAGTPPPSRTEVAGSLGCHLD